MGHISRKSVKLVCVGGFDYVRVFVGRKVENAFVWCANDIVAFAQIKIKFFYSSLI